MARNPIDIPIIHTLYATYKEWHRLLIQFPKTQRYTLGQTCSHYLLTLLEQILGAASVTQEKEKIILLRTASNKLDTLRLLIRLAKDCSCLKNTDYLALVSKLHDIGRMLGGWLKSLSG